MRKIFWIGCCLIIFISCKSPSTQTVELLIINANIVDVATGRISTEKLIAINDDTIVAVEDSSEKDFFDTQQVINARGNFVMPGLWDMHVHFRGGDSLIQENKALLPLFLAFGVTTVRDAGGDITPSVLQWRNQIQKKRLAGPNIFTSGPKLDGPTGGWPGSIRLSAMEDIEPALDSLESLGVDYVKIYDGSISKEIYYATIIAAKARGLKTTGHMPLSAFLMKAVENGLNGSEHTFYVLKSCSSKEDSLTTLNKGFQIFPEIINTYDSVLADEVFTKLSAYQVYITPTLHVMKTLAELADQSHENDSLLSFIGEGIEATYQGRIESAKRAKSNGFNLYSQVLSTSMAMIKPMYRHAVPIIAGSDCGPYNSFIYPGQSLHAELNMLVAAGLSPRQALETSVINGPKFFQKEARYGKVATGKMADLVFLEKNPLENIHHLASITTVVTRGQVHFQEELQEMLTEAKIE